MPDELPPHDDLASLRGLLEQNLNYSKEILRNTEKARSYIFWSQVMGIVKILLIIVPLVLGFLYLKPYLGQVIGTYQDLLGTGSSGTEQPNQTNADLLNRLQNLQKSGNLKQIEQLLK
ncbi:MAG: hypothetical protein HY973_02850 [Candidatus Kerfeldbacteria bacterium]|nr:hypothetical protein [Candidatus Kerfeldbacteria bacterium]